MDFNKKRCLELLKERKSLQKEGKFLRDSDKMKSEELTRYLILLDDQIFWESLKNIAKYAHVSTPTYKVMRHLLPGPYTFILEAKREVPKILLEKRKTVGIRVPDNLICHTLLKEFDHPIISTSAIVPGHNYLNDPEDIAEVFEHTVDLFIDADYGGSDPSTIIDFSSGEPEITREGKGYEKALLYL